MYIVTFAKKCDVKCDVNRLFVKFKQSTFAVEGETTLNVNQPMVTFYVR